EIRLLKGSLWIRSLGVVLDSGDQEEEKHFHQREAHHLLSQQTETELTLLSAEVINQEKDGVSGSEMTPFKHCLNLTTNNDSRYSNCCMATAGRLRHRPKKAEAEHKGRGRS
ncbi:hypothetical protein GOODEAATRI_031160, partial [Goodea atripinnis]